MEYRQIWGYQNCLTKIDAVFQKQIKKEAVPNGHRHVFASPFVKKTQSEPNCPDGEDL